MRKGDSQTVTGIRVNKKVNVPRKYYRRIRAIIYNCQKYGVTSQISEETPNIREHLYGHAFYIMGINSAKGKRLLQELDKINWSS